MNWLLFPIIFGMLDSHVSKPKSKKGNPMLRAFNSFQVVTLFAALPFIISWLYNATFPFATGALWIAAIAYAVLYVFQIVTTYCWVDD